MSEKQYHAYVKEIERYLNEHEPNLVTINGVPFERDYSLRVPYTINHMINLMAFPIIIEFSKNDTHTTYTLDHEITFVLDKVHISS